VQPLLRVAKGDQVPYTLALVFGRSGSRVGRLRRHTDQSYIRDKMRDKIRFNLIL
jgi:hypothetical protein